MITLKRKFYGSEITLDGTYDELLNELTQISRALIYRGFDKDEIIDAVVEGFFEDEKITPLDGDKITDQDIIKALGEKEVTAEVVKGAIAKLKEKEGE